MGGKREPPTSLKRILDLDMTLTNKFCSFANNITALRSLRNHGKGLEISCHGIPWLCFTLILMWFSSSSVTQHFAINLLFALLLDIVFVAVIKATTRRRRPADSAEGGMMMLGPDKFSFPSGHASRAVFLACFFIHLWPVSMFFFAPLVAWATAVCISRVLLRRHHILDVFAGVLLGLFETLVMAVLWIPEEWAAYIYSLLSDEVQEGSSFDV